MTVCELFCSPHTQRAAYHEKWQWKTCYIWKWDAESRENVEIPARAHRELACTLDAGSGACGAYAVDDGVRRGAVVGFIMNRHAGTVLAEYSDIHAAAIAQVELPGQVHCT